MKKILAVVIVVSLLLGVALALILPSIDDFEIEGEVAIDGLSAPVRIVRDGKGVPYVYADNFEDVIAGQGFVTAQDRMFQLQMMRYLSQGRLSELVGEKGLPMDTMVHLIDVPAQAKRQLAILADEDLRLMQSYLKGVNGYLSQRADELTLPLRNDPPQPWAIEELVAVQIFNSWGSTVNWREELLSQQLIDQLGVEQAAEISQITINADNERVARASSSYDYQRSPVNLTDNFSQLFLLPDGIGSNCWATGSRKSAGGLPIVSSDPHIDARRLPGF